MSDDDAQGMPTTHLHRELMDTLEDFRLFDGNDSERIYSRMVGMPRQWVEVREMFSGQ